MNKEKVILIFLIVLLFVINYSFLDRVVVNFFDETEYVEVDRVIDGDTIVVAEESVRLLGINSPERGEAYHEKAKEFLEGLILDNKIRLEKSNKKDKYGRILAFIFISQTNLNVELVRWGLANVYILDNKKYEDELRDAWKECVKKNVNLCKKSRDECAGCIEILEFEEQTVKFRNNCFFDCSLHDWEIKDEGRKKFVFEDFVLSARKDVTLKVGDGKDSEEILYWRGENYVWTNTGDTLFLRDDENKLVLWKEYYFIAPFK